MKRKKRNNKITKMGLKSSLSKEAPINEIIGLLYNFGQSDLEGLRKSYPQYSELLKPGILLGEENTINETEELKVRSEVSKIGLKLILGKTDKLLPKIKNRLKLLNNIQFISQIVVTISGASILVFLQEKHGETVKYIVGGLTLLAGLLSLFVQNKSGTIGLGENSLSKVFSTLTDHKLNAEHYLDELIILEKLNYSSSKDQISQIIQKSNEISLSMKKIIEKI